MTNTEGLGSSGNREPNRLRDLFDPENKTIERMEAITAFYKLTPEQIPQFVRETLPTPLKDQPFNPVPQDKENNPLLVEIRQWPASERTGIKVWAIASLMVASVTALIGYLLSLLFNSPAIFGFIVGVILVWVTVGFVKVVVPRRKQKKQYAENLKLVEDFVAGLDESTWDLMCLEKWALARYDFKSREDFVVTYDTGKCVLAKEGPMAGLLVSPSTGEEWKLRPEQAEAV
jgi:hypothetical protein